MDKYTYNIKVDKIQKLVKKGDYDAAVKVADTVDWDEVHSVRLLTITASAYEHIRDYKTAIELLEMAYEESAVGKRILYKLTGLAIADGNVELAQKYYEMYLQEAPEENGRYLLRYLLAELKGEALDKRIAILETYRKYEFEEEWALRLAELYDEAGMTDECVKLCDEIILWFGVGSYVDQALALKEKHAPLSAEQQDKLDNRAFYEQRYREVVEEYTDRDAAGTPAEEEAEAAPEEETEPGQDWVKRILLVDAENLENAIPKALEALAAYHKAENTPMAKLTRISALRFNAIGLEAAKEHIADKDLLVDGAAVLTEELLADILRFVRSGESRTVFVFADDSTELAYLDAQLGAFLKEAKEELPAIDVDQAEEELRINVEDVLAGTVAAETAAPAESLGDTKVVARVEEARTEAPAAMVTGDTVPVTAEVKAVRALAEENAEKVVEAIRQEEANADQVSIRAREVAEIEQAAAPETAAAEETEDEDYRQETIEDFFREQGEAATEILAGAGTAAAEKIDEVKAAADTAAEAAAEAVKETAEKAEEKAEEAEELLQNDTKAEEEAEEAFLRHFAAQMDAFNDDEVKAEEPEKAEEAAVAELPEEVREEKKPALSETQEIAEEMKAELEKAVKAAEETPAEEEKAEEIAAEITEEIKAEPENKPEEPATDLGETQQIADEMKAELERAAQAAEAELAAAKAKLASPEELYAAAKAAKQNRVAGSMSIDAFITYAKNYIASIDCVLEDGGEVALMNAAESRKAKGIALTKAEAENMLENAADLSEKKGGLFARRYDRDGCLILKNKFIS